MVAPHLPMGVLRVFVTSLATRKMLAVSIRFHVVWGIPTSPKGVEIASTPRDCLYACIEKHAMNGSILDVGCGSGSNAQQTQHHCLPRPTGIDISTVAIDKAEQRTAQNNRADKNRFFRSEIPSAGPAIQGDPVQEFHRLGRTKTDARTISEVPQFLLCG